MGPYATRRAAATEAAPAATKDAVRLLYARDLGAESCPEQEKLQSGVRARLGRDPFREDGTKKVAIRVGRAGTALKARVEVRDLKVDLSGPTTREAIAGHNCFTI